MKTKDITNSFLPNPEIFHWFTSNKNEDFFVWMIGYHNFLEIKAEKKMRMQQCHTIHFVVSGKGYLVINNEKYTVNQYDFFYIDKKSKFCYYPDSQDPWEYIFFEFDGNRASEYIKNIKFENNKPIKACQNPQKILDLFSHTFLKNNKLSSNLKISYFRVLSIFFACLESMELENEKKVITHSNVIDEILYFIELKSSDSSFKIDSICNVVGFSHSHLCRLFKESMGISIATYVKNYRLEKAKELLLSTNSTLEEIAFLSGFNEYVYFLRSFKNKFGITPTELRNSIWNRGRDNEQ